MPELAAGALPPLRPDELEDELDDDPDVLDDDPDVLDDEELLSSEPELSELALPEPVLELPTFVCVLPGSTKATAPAAATLATATPAVIPRTLARPRSRAATAPSSCFRFILLQCSRAVGVPCRQLLRHL